MTKDIPTACKAIVRHNGKFLLYLRDEKPNIPFPAYWDCFGGVIEPGETIEECIRRELIEELNIELYPEYLETIKESTSPTSHKAGYTAIFIKELDDENMNKLKFMGEGQRYGLFTADELVGMKVVPHFRKYFK